MIGPRILKVDALTNLQIRFELSRNRISLFEVYFLKVLPILINMPKKWLPI